MRSLLVVVLSFMWLSSVVACVDTPLPDPEPQARLVAAWDPLSCGDTTYRVVIELEDERGVPLRRSAPCKLGGVTIDVPYWGIYLGRVYAWELTHAESAEIRSVSTFRLEIDSPVVHWFVDTPQ